jgi:hypothetical protein
MEVVALVEHLALDVRVELTKLANLAVLLGDQLLVHRGDLYVQILFGEVEVRPEELRGVAVVIPLDGEFGRLVLPEYVVEIQEPGELELALVSKLD